jgi:hypothetical protein
MESHSVFTDFVRTYAGDEDVPIDVFDKISSALRNHLKRRGIWKIGPRILGYEGKSWDSEALQDLTYHCYCHVFIGMSEKNPGGKHEYWRLKVEAGNAIEKQVYQSIKHFLHDLQNKSDKGDSAIFKNLKSAVKELVEERKLLVVVGDSSSFSSDWVCGIAESQKDAIQFEHLLEFVGENDDWQSALSVVHRVSKKSARFAKDGIVATIENGNVPFRFGDLKNAVAKTAQSPKNEQIIPGETEEKSKKSRTNSKRAGYELEEQDSSDLEKQIHEKIDALERGDSVKQKLHRIVDFMTEELRGAGSDVKVSQAEMGRQLNIPKQTLNDYMKTIRDITRKLRNDS